jgi:flavin reductase (DIM6/NTAB) family NADH-FMN oxidoreductase RutF
VFTVSYPKPSQVLFTSLAASPRVSGGDKPVLQSFDPIPATRVDGAFFEDSYLFLECRHLRTIDGFGENCLITGEIVAARADREFVRVSELDDQDLILHSPLFAYLAPGRFASIERSHAFPFPVDMKK